MSSRPTSCGIQSQYLFFIVILISIGLPNNEVLRADNGIIYQSANLEALAPLAERETYPIRTRLVIERNHETGEAAASIADFFIARAYAENMFDGHFHLSVDQLTYRTPLNESGDAVDARKFPNHLTIVIKFQALNDDSPSGGFSPYPDRNPNIIVLDRSFVYQKFALAHELGHFFGLPHTFEHAFASHNLEEQSESMGTHADRTRCLEVCLGFDQIKCTSRIRRDKNCRNIMTYCNHFPKYITPDQLSIAIGVLRIASTRQNLVINENEHLDLIKPTTEEIYQSALDSGGDFSSILGAALCDVDVFHPLRPEEQVTPLVVAAALNKVDCVRLILKIKKETFGDFDDSDRIAAFYAKFAGHLDLAEEIAEATQEHATSNPNKANVASTPKSCVTQKPDVHDQIASDGCK